MSERNQEPAAVDMRHKGLNIHTRKITDSCRDKDCIEDLRVYLTRESQAVLDTAAGAKVRCAELLFAAVEVDSVAFNRNHYCIDVTFFYRILADATVGALKPVSLYGLAVFSKRAVLCGEESHAHIFRSDSRPVTPDGLTRFRANMPTAVVEVLDPMVLSSRVAERCGEAEETASIQIPHQIQSLFDDPLVISGEKRRLYVTLGQFSLIRLERDAQLAVQALPFELPTKECCDSPIWPEDPCELFSKIPFPTEQFSPTGCDAHPHCEEDPGAAYQTCGN